MASLQIGTPRFVPAGETEQLTHDTTASCNTCWRPAAVGISARPLCGRGSDVCKADDGNCGFGPWLD